MEWLEYIVYFFTDAHSLGFPMLIAIGLGVILYLMKKTSEGWQRSDKKVTHDKAEQDVRNYPFKPF